MPQIMPAALHCLCGQVEIQVLSEWPDAVTECNCAACRRLAARWAYFQHDDVRITAAQPTVGFVRQDADAEGDIEFHHCPRCGCCTHYRGVAKDSTRVALNARLLPNDAMTVLRVRRFDGAGAFSYLD